MKKLIKVLLVLVSMLFTKNVHATQEWIDNNSSKMFLAKKENNSNINNIKENNYRQYYIKQQYIPVSNKENKNEKARLKHIYISASAGYLYTKKDMTFTDIYDCRGVYKAGITCRDNKSNPIALNYDDNYFAQVAFGVNSESVLRFELAHSRLLKKMDIDGINRVGADNKKYFTDIRLSSNMINLYFDFIEDRRIAYSVLVPYLMTGIGISDIKLNDVEFNGAKETDGTIKKKYTIFGNRQKNKTIVYGAGLSAGINNYLSLDIGYRYYDFGKLLTDITMQEENGTTSPPTITNYDIGLKTNFESHAVLFGIKIQI